MPLAEASSCGMRIDNNQAIDSYGVATLRPTDESRLGVIPQRRHDVTCYCFSQWRIMVSSALPFLSSLIHHPID